MCQLEQAMQYLNEWIEENQPRITNAVLAAFLKIDGVSEAMTDSDAVGTERVTQKINGLITAAHGVLSEFIGEAFSDEFSEVTGPLQLSLIAITEQIATERRSVFIELLIQRHGNP